MNDAHSSFSDGKERGKDAIQINISSAEVL